MSSVCRRVSRQCRLDAIADLIENLDQFKPKNIYLKFLEKIYINHFRTGELDRPWLRTTDI